MVTFAGLRRLRLNSDALAMLGSRHRDEHAEAGNVMQTTQEYRRHLASDWDTKTLEVALAAARQEAARGVRRLGLTRADREDLQQDILIVLIERCRHFNPERATWAAYVGLVARHVIADRARALRETFQPAFEGLDIDAFPAGASARTASTWRCSASTRRRSTRCSPRRGWAATMTGMRMRRHRSRRPSR